MKIPEILDRRPVLYRLYDDAGRVIYIGHSCKLRNRITSHRLEQWWWPLVARIRVELHPTKEAAWDSEKVAIQEEQPAFNTWHTGREPGVADHWTARDIEMCREWQRVNGNRGFLPTVTHYPEKTRYQSRSAA